MGWTEDRVETLKTLWVNGLTASQIAGELGQGVTRNAVIGKVHRLKLAARAKPATANARAKANARTRKKTTGRTSTTNSNYSAPKRRSTNSAASSAGATALKPSIESAVELKTSHELEIPLDERVTLLELTEDKCKWAIGDPLLPGFYFCGRKSLEKGPYCEFHSKRAYHKIDRKKK